MYVKENRDEGMYLDLRVGSSGHPLCQSIFFIQALYTVDLFIIVTCYITPQLKFYNNFFILN